MKNYDALFRCEYQPVPSAENQNIQPKQPILQPFMKQKEDDQLNHPTP